MYENKTQVVLALACALQNHHDVGTGTGTSDATGGGQSRENRPPYYALCYIMRVQ